MSVDPASLYSFEKPRELRFRWLHLRREFGRYVWDNTGYEFVWYWDRPLWGRW